MDSQFFVTFPGLSGGGGGNSGTGIFLSESCLEVSGPIFSSQFISHYRVLDSQFLLQMDLSLGSKSPSWPGRRKTKEAT